MINDFKLVLYIFYINKIINLLKFMFLNIITLTYKMMY